MSTVQDSVKDPAKDPACHSAKRKAAKALLEASYDKPTAYLSQPRAAAAAPLQTPEVAEPSVKRQRKESDLPFSNRSKTGVSSTWREVCRSFTSCDLSLLSSPDLISPQQLLLTQQGVTVVLMDRPAQAAAAVALLRASMHDPLLGLDLEWQADTSRGSDTPVSLIQIASASCALLVRICSMKFKLPPEVLALLR